MTGKWILPGLIDAHVHVFQSGGPYARPDIIDLCAVRPCEEEVRRTRARLPQTFAHYLASGITAVVDVGGPMWNFEVRDRAWRERIAPRVAVAGPLLGTYAPPELAGQDDLPIVEIRSPERARAEVLSGASLAAEMAWVRAAIEASHAAGVRVVAHATQLRVARAVVEAGVDVLAHSIDDQPVDAGLLDLMTTRGVVYTTTLVVQEGYREVLGRRVEPTDIERRPGDPEAIASFNDLETLPRTLLPGRVRRLAAEAGLTPMQVLVAATRGGAAVMGRSRDLGTLEAGKLADMVILNADPLADIRHTRRIHRVIKGGEVFDPNEIARTRLAPR